MKTYRFLLITVLVVSVHFSFAQTLRGKILTPASPITNPMDPNGDGFMTKTTAGFSNDGDYIGEFELPMFGIPKVGNGEVNADNVGNPCGITDLIPDKNGFSVYAFRDANNNLICRFRVGANNPSVEAWTLLLDVDGLFGPGKDPNATANNPGFELDITLIKRNNAGVLVYNIDGTENCGTQIANYPISTNFQISLADEVSCGDPDYFYDFYVPFPAVAAAFNASSGSSISAATGLRYVAVTNTSATCAMDGKIADISGLNNDDPLYDKCDVCAFTAIIENQCPTAVNDLCSTCLGFNASLPAKPTINEPIRAGQTVITGTSPAGTFLRLFIYPRVGGTDAAPVWSTTPREEKVVAVPVSAWSITLSSPLLAYDQVVAKSQLTIDGSGCDSSNGNTTSVSVTVVEPNAAPVAQNQLVTVTEDIPKAITLVATDPDGNALTYTIIASPAHGTLSGTAPNLIYTPSLNYNGPDSFTFRASDGAFNSNTATVTITVVPVNDLPVANSQTLTTNEDVALPITLSATDVDGDPLTYTSRAPAHGTLSCSNCINPIYTPTLNYFGPDSFTFTAFDGTGNSNIATVTITVNSVNDLPVATNLNLTTPEDTPLGIILLGSDVETVLLTYNIVSGPTNGTLTGSGSSRTYTPNTNFNGTETFTYQVNDGSANSNIATVTIIVTPVNDAPIALDQSLTTLEDVALPITLTATHPDADGAIVSFTIVTPPQSGTLSGTAPNLIYTPNPNYNGQDRFTFIASDGTDNSNVATIFITVTPVADAPIASSQLVTTNEDTPVSFTIIGSDPDGAPVTYTILSSPTHGTLSGTAPNLTYSPTADFNGSDSFTFKVNDGTSDSNIAAVTITVNPVNDAPIALNKTVLYVINTPVNFTIEAFDADITDVLTFSVLTQPLNGTVTGTPPNLTFTPALNFIGTTSFTFKVNDGLVDSNVGTVTFRLDDGINYPPVALDQVISVDEDTNVSIVLSASDPNGDPLTYTIVSGPLHGTISGTGQIRIYTPDLNYFGSDSFTFKASDGIVESNVATVSITVNPINDAPIANNQSVTVIEDTPKSITLTGSDVDGDPLTFIIVSPPLHGVLSGSGASLTYTPDPNDNGQDSFTFQVNDGTLNSNIATVSINVTPANDPPLAVNDAIVTNEDVAVTFSITNNDTDSDGTINPATVDLDPSSSTEDKTFTVAGEGTYVVDNIGKVTFNPVLNYNGVATPISYTVKDNDGDISNVASILVTVNPINDAPVVQNTTVTINEDETASICFTVTDVENDPSVFTGGASLGGHGSLVLDPSKGPFCFLYTPVTDFNGQDQVEVTVCDQNDPSICSAGIITINITPVNDPPVVKIAGAPVDKVSGSTPEDTPVTICFDAIDPEGDQVSIGTITNTAGGGTLTPTTSVGGQFCFIFTPATNFTGVSTWQVNVCDDGVPSLCKQITIEINVTPVQDAPVTVSQTVTVLEDTPTSITLIGTDPDVNDVLTYIIVTPPAHGTLTGTGANITYTPDPNYNGSDSFTFKVNDGTVDSNVSTFDITVTPVNDPPVISAIPTIITPEDTEVQICVGVSDIDGDQITYQTPVNVSGGGTVTPSTLFAFCYVFMPAKDFNGDAFWKFTVCDSGNPQKCTEVIVKITVTPVNDPPVAVDDLITAQSFAPSISNIIANDTDVDRDPLVLTITPISGPYHGTVVMKADGTFEYKSNMGFMGIDSVRYQVCDTGTPSLCDEGLVVIEVGPAPFKIYNGLSPNGDNRNDYWRIDGIEAFPNNRVRVFDRYNNLIFETSGYNNDDNSWRGQTNHSMVGGNAPEGTYFYSVDLGDGSSMYSGYIVLKKN